MSDATWSVMEGMFWMALITAALVWYAIWDGRREDQNDKSLVDTLNGGNVPGQSESDRYQKTLQETRT